MRYYNDSLKKKSVYAISKYKCYKNKLHSINKAAKRNYYIIKYKAIKSDIKQTWQLLKKTINNKIMPSSTIKEININNKIISDKHEMSNKFNEYFTNIGPTLANKIPHVIIFNLFKTNSRDSIFIRPTDEHEM